MAQPKRSFEEAFVRKKCMYPKVDDYYVEHTVYKTLELKPEDNGYLVKTANNSNFIYGLTTITNTASSATLFNQEKKVTKTDLITLFSELSKNDIWKAVFYKRETEKKWEEELVAEIKAMQQDDVVQYIKKNFETIGKVSREMIGQKLFQMSDNNYYLVRDLDIYFDELQKSSKPTMADKKSIRKLDVNSLQSLIFNGVKYMLK